MNKFLPWVNIEFLSVTHLTTKQYCQQTRDAELIAGLCKADEHALEQLYHQYYPRLYRFIGRITGRDDLVDEIINDVMFVVWNKSASYDHSCKPSTWILGIAYNKARQVLRDAIRNDNESLDEMDEDNAWFGQPDAAQNQLEIEDWLESALNTLTPEHRAVIELTYYHGLHYSEIALIMGCPENTVKTRMFHARKKLAQLVNFHSISN